MSKRVTLGSWAPDLPPLTNPGVTVAKNCTARPVGYGPLASLVSLGEDPLAAYARGAIAGLDSAGNPFNFAGDAAALYRLASAGTEDVSKAGGYSATDDTRWGKAQYGQDVFFCNPNDELQFFNLRTSSLFEDVSADAPRARYMDVIGQHLVLGNIYTPDEGPLTDAVAWPAIDNPFSWPTAGSDLALSVQSGRQRLKGNGGWVQAVVGGAEVGAIFQERAIWRMDYRGGDVIYEFSPVEMGRGLYIPQLAIPIGRRIFYCAEDGFYLFDYVSSKPIGESRVNRFFLDDLDANYLDRVSWVSDPDKPRVIVSYPGAGNTAGTPNKQIIYDYALDRFTHAEVNVELLTRVIAPASASLDALPDEDIDVAGGSFDDRPSAIGAEIIGAYNTSHVLGQFTGSALAATIESGDVELQPGRRSRTASVRPLVDGAEPTVQVAGLAKSGATVTFGPEKSRQPDGKCPSRVDGRYHRFRLNIPSGEDSFEAIGLDVMSTPTGTR